MAQIHADVKAKEKKFSTLAQTSAKENKKLTDSSTEEHGGVRGPETRAQRGSTPAKNNALGQSSASQDPARM